MWNVLYYNSNKKAIESYEVANKKFLVELKQKYPTFNEFEKALKNEMQYHYWSKCEWELVICKNDEGIWIKPWIGNEDAKINVSNNTGNEFYTWLFNRYFAVNGEIKFDVYDQLLFAWDEFVKDCWWVAKDE